MTTFDYIKELLLAMIPRFTTDKVGLYKTGEGEYEMGECSIMYWHDHEIFAEYQGIARISVFTFMGYAWTQGIESICTWEEKK